MADSYIDTDYIKANLGTGVYDAIAAVTGTSFTQRIYSATALVQSYLRNSGYATPATTTDETVKLAVLGALWQMACSTPETNLALPEAWEDHPARLALKGIVKGDVQIAGHALSIPDAVGGWGFTEHATGATDTRQQRASRKELAGF